MKMENNNKNTSVDDIDLSLGSDFPDEVSKKNKTKTLIKKESKKPKDDFLKNRKLFEEKQKKNISLGLVVVVCILISLFFSTILGTTMFFVGKAMNSDDDKNNSKIISVDDVQEESAAVDAVDKVLPSVVSIIVSKDVARYRNVDPWSYFFGDGNEESGSGEKVEQEIGSGSGFIVSEDGLIMTNKHVVFDEDADYTVNTTDGKEYKATVKSVDPTTDLAILKIDGDNFQPVEFGNSDDLKMGQTVIAIGNAIGEFPNTVSKGIISGLGRDIQASSTVGQSESLTNIIQTDAAINQGNSGGPLIDLSGKVVGVNVARVESVDNIGFSLPSKEIVRAIESYEKEGEIKDDRAFLGVNYVLINKQIKANFNLEVDYGALVVESQDGVAIVPDSAADKAGLKKGDVILEVDGEKINEDNTLIDYLDNKKAGDKITLKIDRDGDKKNIKVELGSREDIK